MSLKIRIDLLFGLLLLLGLAADIGRMTYGARARVQSEDEAMTRISRDFVVAALANLQGAADPPTALRQLVGSLGELRHVRIFLASDGPFAAATRIPSPDRLKAPDWFADLVGAHGALTVQPAVLGGRKFGDIVIASDPSDEVNEVWQDVKTLALTGGAIALAAFFGASILLGRTLKPLSAYAAALGALRDGDYQIHAEPWGSPEFVDICDKINALARELAGLSASNRQLIQRLMDVQEEERGHIAHELHDEIGPHLFALRARAAVLEAGLRRQGSEKEADLARSLNEQVEALQGQNRRILRSLRPPALEDLGLADALLELVRGWRESQDQVALDLRLPDSLDACGPRESLALYRFVQEALTNLFRHAGASRASVELAFAGDELHATVQDDGGGVREGAAPGLGLTGMKERIRALGGTFSIASPPSGGARVEAVLPISKR